MAFCLRLRHYNGAALQMWVSLSHSNYKMRLSKLTRLFNMYLKRTRWEKMLGTVVPFFSVHLLLPFLAYFVCLCRERKVSNLPNKFWRHLRISCKLVSKHCHLRPFHLRTSSHPKISNADVVVVRISGRNNSAMQCRVLKFYVIIDIPKKHATFVKVRFYRI